MAWDCVRLSNKWHVFWTLYVAYACYYLTK
jgi:sugar phosphate permease